MKRTAYVIKGQSFEKPTDLPEGYTVEEVAAEDPKWVKVVTWSDVEMTVEPDHHVHDGDQVSVSFSVAMSNVLLSPASARKVRDCLNAILNEEDKPKRRVFQAPDSSTPWWEFEPGLFTNARTWEETRGRTSVNNVWGIPLAELEQDYENPLTDVTHLHPEINEGA